MKKLVLTGGPCGGKTACLKEIARSFGDRVLIMPEAATLFLKKHPIPPNGYRDWGAALNSDLELRRYFQKEVFRSQQEQEESLTHQAHQEGKQLLVCDRGLLDGAAYWPGGLEDFLAHFQLDLGECHARYHRVIHLQSLVMAGTNSFSRRGNPHRFEDPHEARLREDLTHQAWETHPGRVIIKVQEMEKKIQATLLEVARILDQK